MKLAWLPTTVALVALCGAALAQDEKQAPIPFAGGELTITQKEEYGEKVLAFDGKELAHNYVVYYDRTVTLGDVAVAMVDVGDGGNACGPAKVLVWKPEGGDIRSETVGADCGAPPGAGSRTHTTRHGASSRKGPTPNPLTTFGPARTTGESARTRSPALRCRSQDRMPSATRR